MSATLGGVPLDAVDASWSETTGVRPYQRVFQVAGSAADKLFQRETVDLVLSPEGHRPVTYSNLYVLSIQAGPTPFQAGALVSDKRWLWPRVHVLRRYNVRRRTPDVRRLAQEGVPVAVQKLVPTIGYASFSLYPRSAPANPWTAAQVLEDVLEAVCGKGGYRIIELPQKPLPVEQLEIDDSGDQAIARVLRFFPGIMIYLDETGVACVDLEKDRKEAAQITKLGAPSAGFALQTLVDLSKCRPQKIRVLFDRELELRFDSREEGSTATVSANSEPREMVNVFPIPDVSLSVSGKTYNTGTYLPADTLFSAWTGWPAGMPALSHTIVQQSWLSPRFLARYSRPRGAIGVDTVSHRRVTTTVQNYRQTYQISQRWMDKIYRLRNYRVGILDEATGSRASSQAFADYAYAPTVIGLQKRASDPKALVGNVAGYATLLKDAKQLTAATIDLKDAELGVIKLEYQLDPDGSQSRVFPSQVVGPDGTAATIPTGDARFGNKGGAGVLLQFARLKPSHRVAVVLTATPAAPNDERQLYAYEVTPQEASEALGGQPIPTCKGPVWDVRISANVMQARWEWRDEQSQSIASVFGVATAGVAPGGTRSEAEDPLGDPCNLDAVRAVAKAAAATLYAQFLDRAEGGYTSDLAPGVHPAGSIAGVTHRILSDGRALTSLFLPSNQEPVDMFALLPEGVRRQVLRLAQ